MTVDNLPSDLQGKTVLVTGAASGLGEAIARGLGSAGAHIIAADIQAERVAQIADEIGDGARALEIDTSSEASIENAFRSVGELHGLVNSAGIVERIGLLDVTAANFDRIVNINLRGYVLCAREAAKKMIETGAGGGIVNIASTNAHLSYKEIIAYGASKGGVLAVTRAMAHDLAEHDIRVNSISPGVVRTALNEYRLVDPAQVEYSSSRTILGRIGVPDDVVGIVEFFLSPRSAWITGADLLVDGGERVHG